jgi:hypothetical protein
VKSPANRRDEVSGLLVLVPALVVLYLSIHQEIQKEKDASLRDKPQVMAHAGHPH